MSTRRQFSKLLALASLCAPLALMAQAFPSKPITLVVPVPPGGLVDTSARLISEPLGRLIGQSVVIDNKGGASGNLAYQQVARAPKDGHTLLVSYSGYHIANPILMSKLPWELKDLTPVGLITVATNVVAVHPSVPANNLRELIALAKAQPGKLSFASNGAGTVSHLSGELLNSEAMIKLLHVPYKGAGQAVNDVLGGHVPLLIGALPTTLAHVNAGRLKAIGVTTAQRSPAAPAIPTFAESGFPSLTGSQWLGLSAPRGMPAPIVQRLTALVPEILRKPDIASRLDELQTLAPKTPIVGDEFVKVIRSQIDTWTQVARRAKVEVIV